MHAALSDAGTAETGLHCGASGVGRPGVDCLQGSLGDGGMQGDGMGMGDGDGGWGWGIVAFRTFQFQLYFISLHVIFLFQDDSPSYSPAVPPFFPRFPPFSLHPRAPRTTPSSPSWAVAPGRCCPGYAPRCGACWQIRPPAATAWGSRRSRSTDAWAKIGRGWGWLGGDRGDGGDGGDGNDEMICLIHVDTESGSSML